MDEHELHHNRIEPHSPEKFGVVARSNRTLREAMEGEELTDLLQARGVIAQMAQWHNTEQLHSALGYLRPMDCYRGDPARLHEVRRRKIAEARHRRRETNLKLKQPTLQLVPTESIANEKPRMSHCG